jgi:hypothetical protein
MMFSALADAVLVLHLGFILYVALGGILVRWWRRAALVHLPCAAYGVAIELWSWVCPLTPLENRLRALGGERGYSGGFVEHYLVSVIYPRPLTRAAQAGLALVVVVLNVILYAWALRRRGADPVESRAVRTRRR